MLLRIVEACLLVAMVIVGLALVFVLWGAVMHGCEADRFGTLGNKCYGNHTCDTGLTCFKANGIPEVCAKFGDGGVP